MYEILDNENRFFDNYFCNEDKKKLSEWLKKMPYEEFISLRDFLSGKCSNVLEQLKKMVFEEYEKRNAGGK